MSLAYGNAVSRLNARSVVDARNGDGGMRCGSHRQPSADLKLSRRSNEEIAILCQNHKRHNFYNLQSPNAVCEHQLTDADVMCSDYR